VTGYKLDPASVELVMDWWYRCDEEQVAFLRGLLEQLRDGGLAAVTYYTVPELTNPSATNVLNAGLVVQVRPETDPGNPEAQPVARLSIDTYP